MRLWWSFRSPYVPCFSIATEPVNVPGWLTATTLATRAPGQENRRWRGPFVLCRLTFGSGTSLRPCRLSPPPASLRAAPVSRQRLIDFQPDPVIAVTVLFSLRGVTAVKRNITGIPQPSGRGRHEGKTCAASLIPAGDIGKLRVQHFCQIARCQFNIQPAFAARDKDRGEFL